jgi:hypothetical protein
MMDLSFRHNPATTQGVAKTSCLIGSTYGHHGRGAVLRWSSGTGAGASVLIMVARGSAGWGSVARGQSTTARLVFRLGLNPRATAVYNDPS